MVKIKCKIDCQIADCPDCAEIQSEIKDTLQYMRDEISETEDKEGLLDDLHESMIAHEVTGETIAIIKTKLRELGVTIPEEEKKND